MNVPRKSATIWSHLSLVLTLKRPIPKGSARASNMQHPGALVQPARILRERIVHVAGQTIQLSNDDRLSLRARRRAVGDDPMHASALLPVLTSTNSAASWRGLPAARPGQDPTCPAVWC